MTEKRDDTPKKPRRLSDVVIPGRDYPAKVKITELLDHEVTITNFEHSIIYKQNVDENGEVTLTKDADYFLVYVLDEGAQKFFATGARPIRTILDHLEKVELPLTCTFVKEGRTYRVL